MEGFDARHVMATRIAQEWQATQSAAPEPVERTAERPPHTHATRVHADGASGRRHGAPTARRLATGAPPPPG